MGRKGDNVGPLYVMILQRFSSPRPLIAWYVDIAAILKMGWIQAVLLYLREVLTFPCYLLPNRLKSSESFSTFLEREKGLVSRAEQP